jgi:hypothetical protein
MREFVVGSGSHANKRIVYVIVTHEEEAPILKR